VEQPFSEKPSLWRKLGKEAEYYGLDRLSHVTHAPEPNPFGMGIFHWLEAQTRKTEYKNSYFVFNGASVRGLLDRPSKGRM